MMYSRTSQPRTSKLGHCSLFIQNDDKLVLLTIYCLFFYCSGKAACIRPYDPTNNHHQWIVLGESICNLYDNKQALDIEGGSRDNGASLIAYTYHGKDNQKWMVQYV